MSVYFPLVSLSKIKRPDLLKFFTCQDLLSLRLRLVAPLIETVGEGASLVGDGTGLTGTGVTFEVGVR